MERKMYQQIAELLHAVDNCRKSGNKEWEEKHGALLARIMRNTAPSGSGWDEGTKLCDESTPEKLVFRGSFHHMDENGFYDGWTEHTITVRASLAWGIDVKISGRNRNDIKEYIHEMFHDWLTGPEVSRAQVDGWVSAENARREG